MTAGTDTQLDSANNGLATRCPSATAYIDPSLLQIEGTPVAQKGDQVTYQLSEDLGCSPSQKVSWTTIGNSQAVKVGAAMTSSFQKAGEYVVVAKIEGSQPTSSHSSAPTTFKSTSDTSSTISFKTVVVSTQAVISGPDIAMVGSPVSYSLAVPAGLALRSADWDFGDSSSFESSLGPVSHTYGRPGQYQISVKTVDSNGVQNLLTHQVNVLMIQDGLECVSDLAISGPAEAVVGIPVSLSLYIPSCLTSKITAVKWNFGDNSTSNNQSVQHTYQSVGDYQIAVQIFIDSSPTPWVTLVHDISANPPTPTPTPTPEPTPINPNACSTAGEKRSSQSELYSGNSACGIDGIKTMSYRDVTVEECKLTNNGLEWTQVSKTKELQSEGSCQGQSCTLPDGSLLKNGGSKIYFSTSTPTGSCSSASQIRACNNGVLSGSSEAIYTICHEGCGDFGSHGTTKTNIITGETNVALTCEFGEQGYFSVFNQVSDQICKEGQIVTSNTHQGDIKTQGLCPIYSYVPSELWTSCSADCGGKQSRLFTCKDDKGIEAPAERCKAAPIEERLCDGNPAAVTREEHAVTQEEANSSERCPANQIGVIAKSREVTTTTTFACIDHSIQQAKEEISASPWVSEKYCRTYVAHRCSGDSITNNEAIARYKWMVKCQDQIPVVKEFLEQFKDLGVKIEGKKVEIDTKSRVLYPTFLNRATKPEKVWIAPKVATASCSVPSTIYIASVCVSSCATPEQQILVDQQLKGSPKYVSFIEALTKNYHYVATLKNASSMHSKSIQKTAVDQWVTELLDGDHDIIEFKMKSGRSLRLTPNHPLLAADGLMKAAGDFKVGDKLVVLGGELDPILSLEHMNHYGKVYNLFVKSSDIKKNIVITNGYLNGTAFFQNEGAENLNRKIFKHNMIQGVFSK
jgi:hypothetical protein